MRTCFLLVSIILLGNSVWADVVIFLDGRQLQCRVLSLDKRKVEVDPEGALPFRAIPLNEVKLVRYKDGREVDVEAQRRQEQAALVKASEVGYGVPGANWFLEVEMGYNGYTGLGPRVDVHLFSGLAVNAGAGIALWGYRLSSGIRYYLTWPYGSSFGLGVAYNTGSMGRYLNLDLDTVQNGSVVTEEVALSLKPATTINASYILAFKMGGYNRLYFEAGYGFRVSQESFSVASGQTLTDDDQRLIETYLSPGGVILSIGYGFAL